MKKLRLLSLLATLMLATALSGCSIGYYLHSASGQAALMARRVPIAEAVDDQTIPEAVRARLRRVQTARAFASNALGLPPDKGYRTYASLDRDYAVWSVTATGEFSLQPEEWCFPVAGCVSYRGYFSETKARAFASKLERRGLDVAVRGVAAYSTLGYFDDPVLSTMMRWDDSQLVAIIFHELAHQLLYVKNDTPFNESFASVVEAEGMVRWAAVHGEPGELAGYRQRRASAATFARLVESAGEELRHLYAQNLAPDEMRTRKQAVLARLRLRYEDCRDRGDISSGYNRWFAQDLNNAHLAAVGVYRQWVPALSAVLARSDGNLTEFYAAARALADRPRAEREAELARLNR